MPGRAPAVYARCAACGELVARYVLRGYYHHGKGFDSFIRSYEANARESGRSMKDEFREVSEEAEQEFSEVVRQLERDGKGEP